MFRTVTTGREAPDFEEYAAVAWPALYRFAYLLAGNHADAEDVAQQTLVKAFQAWPRVWRASSPESYVRRILVNAFLEGRRPARVRREVLTDAAPERGRAAGEPEDRLVLWSQVRLLAPRQRAVIVLRFYEDLTERQTAEVLGCSVGTVKSTTHGALTRLRTALAEAGGEEA